MYVIICPLTPTRLVVPLVLLVNSLIFICVPELTFHCSFSTYYMLVNCSDHCSSDHGIQFFSVLFVDNMKHNLAAELLLMQWKVCLLLYIGLT